MKNDELIKKILTEYFSDFKDYHLIILICFTVIIALIQVVQSIWVSRKIERFKNDLKKSEIKFSRYNEMQIKALSESYQLLSDFYEQTINVANDNGSPELKQGQTKKWLEIYYKFHKHYSRNKYIFLPNIKVKLSLIFNNFEKMKTIVSMEKRHSQLFFTDNNGDIEFIGEEEEMLEILNELKKLKKDENIKYSLENITSLKKDIEDFFTALK